MNKGAKFSEEHKAKLSIARLGKKPWNKGIKTTQNLHLKKGIEKKCPVCDKFFYVKLYQLKKDWGKFCSQQCSGKGRVSKGLFEKGDKHPLWIDGNSKNGYPPEFKPALKRKIKLRDNFTCQLCGITEQKHIEKFNRALCVNHIDFNKLNCEEDNLNTLCSGCNVKINWDRSYYTTLFKNKNLINGRLLLDPQRGK